MSNENDEKPRALPTKHVDHFVVDDADVNTFDPAKVRREPPAPRTWQQVRESHREAHRRLVEEDAPLAKKPKPR